MFWDESGVSLLPVVRRTWAPRGHTPVIRHHFKWKRMSMAAALCYGSRGGGASLAFHHQVDAYDTDSLIQALGELRGFLGGQKATLLWDGLPAHRSKVVRAWLRRQRSWLVVEPLPGYAPDAQGGHRRGRAGHPANPQHPLVGLLVPAALRPVVMVSMSLERANLF